MSLPIRETKEIIRLLSIVHSILRPGQYIYASINVEGHLTNMHIGNSIFNGGKIYLAQSTENNEILRTLEICGIKVIDI